MTSMTRPNGSLTTVCRPGFPVSVGPGGSVHVWFDGAYHAQAVGGGQRAAGTSSPPPSQARLTAYQVATTIPATTTSGAAPPHHEDGNPSRHKNDHRWRNPDNDARDRADNHGEDDGARCV